jgi:nuclear GTP-binding protein
MHLLETEKFSDTFGPKAQRKKPKVKFGSIDDLVQSADSMLGEFRSF